MCLHYRIALVFGLSVGEKGAAGEDFDQEESSYGHLLCGVTLHTAGGTRPYLMLRLI